MNPMDVGPYSVFPVKLGLQLGYWGASPPPDALEKVIDAEKLGFDAVFTAEAWGSDAFTPLAWYGSHTSPVPLGTSILQPSARTPTPTAHPALTPAPPSGGPPNLPPGAAAPPAATGLCPP